ncbi:formate transporter FocA [Vibrio sp. 99-8-1]|uniref:formate transporter FocA n=1 Tax=Vibrio sp. 99-8-1 TaxID=2607602 RepID=UPI001493902C|nr:formate transporter FocA [Vibrio sp. 99-8-1]NOI65967.1 formate transporter FocA [Vibrio sp. 99-8-1]
MSTANPPEMKAVLSPKEMMTEAASFAYNKTQKSTAMIISLAIMAGIFIGLAFLFYITVTTGSSSSWGISRFVGGIAFSMGLILIVLCGAELFTSSVLTSIAWANKQIRLNKMVSIWGQVYIGNFIGALLLLLLVSIAGLYQLDHGQWGVNALNIAQHKLEHSFSQAFALGILCNLLVCLAIWLTFSSHNALTKALMVMLPVSMFVSSGFEHCVANMFMVPLGIVIQSTAPESFWLQTGLSPDQYANLNVYQFITSNLIPVTLGNIVGGAVLVGLANWSIYQRPALKTTQTKSISSISLTTSVKDIAMNSNLIARQIMNSNAFALQADMPTELAIDSLTDRNLQGAPVLNVQGELVGFFSVHDVLIDLWCQDYLPSAKQKVVDIMTRDVVAIESTESLLNIIEFMCIDKEQLYPTTSMGIATQFTSLSLEERAKNMKVNRPQILPVIDNGIFVGTISRKEVMIAVRSIYGERINVVESNTVLESA